MKTSIPESAFTDTLEVHLCGTLTTIALMIACHVRNWKFHGPSSLRGSSGGVKDLADDHIVLQRRESGRFELPPYNGGQIVEGIVFRRINRFRGQFFFRLLSNTQPDDLLPHRVGRTGYPIDLEVLPVERPVPGSLDDSLRVRVRQDNCRLIVHPRINIAASIAVSPL